MMSPRKKRILMVCAILAGISIAGIFILTAFEKNIMYFFSPTEIINGDAPKTRSFRIGGLVVTNSVIRNTNDLKVSFILTDTMNEIKVIYEGILPDLFREGQGIVANGKLQSDNIFVADQVLAKHDENYMPPEVAEALKKSGKWKHATAEDYKK
ncbi:MAG: cytochrome c maturation protein CcmE [Pseudomonadota bacterium]|nr:cytochrome c maturation protein CcmE [Pseudomonadota bacterium]